MALTDTQKSTIVFYLNYAGTTLIEGSPNYTSIIVDRLTGLSPYIETQVASVLLKLKDIDSRLEEAAGHYAAKRVGDIELNGDERALLLAERSRYIKQLSSLLDIAVGSGGGAGSGSSGVMFGVCV